MKRFLLLFILLFLLIKINSLAQQNHFTHFTTEDGLSQSSVFSIVQDDIGFMWFATEDGLNKFDGNTFTVFRNNPNDSTSLPDIGIRKAYKDRSGKLWILSLRGKLCKYNPQKNNFKRYTFNSDIISNIIKIITLTEDNNGNLWAISTKGEFFIYDLKKDIFIYKPLSEKFEKQFHSIHVQCALVDNENSFWIGTWEGLAHLNFKNQKLNWYNNSATAPNSLGGDMVFSLAEDEDGKIWIASANGGVSVYNKSTNKFKVYKISNGQQRNICSNRIMSILIDSRKQIWLGSLDKGLDLFDQEKTTFKNFSHNPSIVSSFSIGAVMSIYEDKSGGIWFGTGGGGLNRYDPLNQNFNHIQHIPGNTLSISANPVLAICEDHLGNLWLGSDGGGVNVKEKNSTEFNYYLQNPPFGSNAITVIYEDSKGNIWIGADPGIDSPAGALIRYDRKTKSFSHFNKVKIKFGGIAAVHQDRFGELWIATTSDGIHRFNLNTEKEIVYRTNPNDSTSLGSNSIFSICEDSFGALWFGSISTGLSLFDRKTNSFLKFVNDPKNNFSLGSNSVWCVIEDINKNIWVGTWGGGLNRFDREKRSFKRYNVDNGLAGNIVYGIIPDEEGNLWISTNKGLTKFNTVTFVFTNYDRSNGLLINDFSTGATFKSKDGRLFIGGNSGVISFDPKKITENSYIPNVVITDFRVFDKPFILDKSILFTDEIELTYDQNFFTFEFASLDYSVPKKNIFEYKLEGIDNDWIRSEGRRFASYTDINNGKYKFKVRGSNNSGKFNPAEAVINIIIAPPFWKTWWFRVLAIILISIMLYLLHRYRLNRLLEVERTRNKIARDLHDEVSAGITGIVYFADAVKTEVTESQTPALRKLVGLICESAVQIQEAMSDIIWSINPDNDDWNVVLPKFRRYASDLCESKGINYKIEILEGFSGKSLKMEQRHDLWLVFKEIVTNTVKHSSCKNMDIKLFNDTEFLHLQITDDGIGFDPEIQSSNNGLKNIRVRFKTLACISELITSIGNGTKWKIRIPLTKQK